MTATATPYEAHLEAQERRLLAAVLADRTGWTWRMAVQRGLSARCFSFRWFGLASLVERAGQHGMVPTEAAVLDWAATHHEPLDQSLSEIAQDMRDLVSEGAYLTSREQEEASEAIRRAAIARHLAAVVHLTPANSEQLAEVLDRELAECSTAKRSLFFFNYYPLPPRPSPPSNFGLECE